MIGGDPWLHRYRPIADCNARLVFIPHVGGASTFYTVLARSMPRDIDVPCVQYPSRQERRFEPPVCTLVDRADRVADALRRLPTQSLVLFGHSIGSTIAFEVAARLRQDGDQSLIGLIVSGGRPPLLKHPESDRPQNDSDILSWAKDLGGSPAELLDNPDVISMILPPLRDDFAALASYQSSSAVIDMPISTYAADRDPRVTRMEAERWADHTSAQFRVRTFVGDHFYLSHQPSATKDAINADIQEFSAISASSAAAHRSA